MQILDRLFRRHGQDPIDEHLEGYCFRCRSTRILNNPIQVWMKNGQSRIQGLCTTCGSNMSKMGKLASPADTTR